MFLVRFSQPKNSTSDLSHKTGSLQRDRQWKKLQIVRWFDTLIECTEKDWQDRWTDFGGARSPYTKRKIQFDNLCWAHHAVFGYGGKRLEKQILKEFPDVALVQRADDGGPVSTRDIDTLKTMARSAQGQGICSAFSELNLKVRRCDNDARSRGLRVLDILDDARSLFARAVARCILSEHERLMSKMLAVDKGVYRLGILLRALGAEHYIERLRGMIPMNNVGDPNLLRAKRMREIKQASKQREREAQRSAGSV